MVRQFDEGNMTAWPRIDLIAYVCSCLSPT